MKRELTSPERPAPLSLAHWAVSAVALAGVIAVQIDWDSLGGQLVFDSRPVFVSAVMIVATGWLLATAWLHVLIARRERPLRISAARLWLHATSDLAVGALAVVVLLQGNPPAAAFARLWAIPPALLAVSVPSAAVLVQAAWINRSLGANASREHLDWIRIVIAAALLIVLAWIAATTVWRAP